MQAKYDRLFVKPLKFYGGGFEQHIVCCFAGTVAAPYSDEAAS